MPSTAALAEATAEVDDEVELRDAWSDPRTERIELGADLTLHLCQVGEPIRESPWPIVIEGNGHSLTQSCFEQRLLRQDGTGLVRLRDIWLKRGGSDGPGAAVTTRGEIEIYDSKISQNLAEEPGGGVFSMRRATIVRSVLTGNLANDDGGAVYARRGGVRVVDSMLNGNLVDGSGGAIGSTGDVMVVRSHVDGNTTDGDGGAIYTDEDGDVTVIDSTIDGSTADGPGGAIFTLDGDVTVVRSTLNGNRADDRGGAISGEADVTLIDSTIARNSAVAHVGGGVWARGNLYMSGTTVSGNYAEGQGGGVFGAGDVSLVYSTVSNNIAPIAASVASGDTLRSFGSVIGPPNLLSTGETQPTADNCKAGEYESHGFNMVSDLSCRLDGTGDQRDVPDLKLATLGVNGGFGETHLPMIGSPAIDAVPKPACRFTPFGVDFEGDQHLEASEIDPLAPIESDQRGASRPFGPRCDSGSVEAGADVARTSPGPAAALRFQPGPAADRALMDRLQVRRDPHTDAPPVLPAVRSRDSSSQLARARRELARAERRLRPLVATVKRYGRWSECLIELPVSEAGASAGLDGYSFDARDGTGRVVQPALAPDPAGRSDYTLISFSRERGCRSTATVPGGTADPAREVHRFDRAVPRSSEGRLRRLQRKLASLERKTDRVLAAAAQFDRWESCLGWLPVTEEGDPDGRFGFRYLTEEGEKTYRPAVGIDRTARDDPDYQILTTRPQRRQGLGPCSGDPGEGVDRRADAGAPRGDSASADLLKDAQSLRESVEDAEEPVFEFEVFDQCMFTVGMTKYGSRRGDSGYIYSDRGIQLRPALGIDIAGLDPPQYDILAFPGEEPPQIECNEDAAGEGTDE